MGLHWSFSSRPLRPRGYRYWPRWLVHCERQSFEWEPPNVALDHHDDREFPLLFRPREIPGHCDRARLSEDMTRHHSSQSSCLNHSYRVNTSDQSVPIGARPWFRVVGFANRIGQWIKSEFVG